MLKGLCIFAAGAVVGMFASREIFRKHYQQLADEEVNEVRDYYKGKEEKEEPEVEEVKEEKEFTNEERAAYNQLVTDNNYMTYDYSNVLPPKEEKEEKPARNIYDEPCIISYEEFGQAEYNDIPYETTSITYYADGVVTDEDDEIMEDFEDMIGRDFIDIFNEFPASAVYVRNDLYKVDYEILRDDWNYHDCHQEEAYKKPHQI